MLLEPGVSAIVPSFGSVFRHLLPSAGSLGLVPPHQRYNEMLRLPAARPAALRFLRLAVPPKFIGRRRQGLPGSWGSLVHMPCSTTPEDLHVMDLGHSATHASVLPSASVTASAPTSSVFGAQSHGLHTRCLRFAVTVTRLLLYDHARLASGWRSSLTGRGSHPLGPIVKFPRSTHRFLLTQALPGALTVSSIVLCSRIGNSSQETASRRDARLRNQHTRRFNHHTFTDPAIIMIASARRAFQSPPTWSDDIDRRREPHRLQHLSTVSATYSGRSLFVTSHNANEQLCCLTNQYAFNRSGHVERQVAHRSRLDKNVVRSSSGNEN